MILAIDCGSSSARAVVFDAEGAQQARGEEAYDLASISRRPADLCAAVERAVEAAVSALAPGSRIRDVAFASFVGNWVGVDAQGAPVTRLFTYAESGEAVAAAAAAVRAELGADGERAAYARTGVPVHPSYVPAQLRAEPGPPPAPHRWQTLAALLTARWAGLPAAPVGVSDASWTGLLDVRACEWDARMCEAAGVAREALPELGDGPVATATWPAMAGARLHAGVGDGAAANLGSGCDSPQRVAVTVGTSAAARVVAPAALLARRRVPEGLWCYRVDRARVLVGGALTDGGSVLQWARRLGGGVADSEAAAAAHGLTVLPFLRGERAPGWNDAAHFAIAGLGPESTGADVLRACEEAVALRLALVLRRLAGVAAPGFEVVGSGGALLGSRRLRQALADAVGCRVRLAPAATVWGLYVLVCSSRGGDLSGGVVESSVVEPDPAGVAAMRKALRRQEELYARELGAPRIARDAAVSHPSTW